jgi:hypothetical protein
MKASHFISQAFCIGTTLTALAGCAEQATRPGVPSTAMQVASGGQIVAFTAPHDGKAYLNDDTDHRVVYSTDLRRDRVMRFDPSTDSVRIDGNIAPEGIAAPGHEHSIYFERSSSKDHADLAPPVPAAVAAPTSPTDPNAIPTVRVPIGVQV